MPKRLTRHPLLIKNQWSLLYFDYGLAIKSTVLILLSQDVVEPLQPCSSASRLPGVRAEQYHLNCSDPQRHENASAYEILNKA